jgi:hypothetical protein
LLSGQAAFLTTARTRAAELSGIPGPAKVLYAGDDGFARIVIVAFSPTPATTFAGNASNHSPSYTMLTGVALYGPSGTPADQLEAQLMGGLTIGPASGVDWATLARGDGTVKGSIGVTLLPPGATSISVVTSKDATPAGSAWHSCRSTDGTLLMSLPPGQMQQRYDAFTLPATPYDGYTWGSVTFSAYDDRSITPDLPEVTNEQGHREQATPDEASLIREYAAYWQVPLRSLTVTDKQRDGVPLSITLRSSDDASSQETLVPQTPLVGQPEVFWATRN